MWGWLQYNAMLDLRKGMLGGSRGQKPMDRKTNRPAQGQRGRRVGVCSSDSGDIREGRERGEGERNWSDAREERGEKGDPRGLGEGRTVAAAEAASRRSRGVTDTSATYPGCHKDRWPACAASKHASGAQRGRQGSLTPGEGM